MDYNYAFTCEGITALNDGEKIQTFSLGLSSQPYVPTIDQTVMKGKVKYHGFADVLVGGKTYLKVTNSSDTADLIFNEIAVYTNEKWLNLCWIASSEQQRSVAPGKSDIIILQLAPPKSSYASENKMDVSLKKLQTLTNAVRDCWLHSNKKPHDAVFTVRLVTDILNLDTEDPTAGTQGRS